MTMIQVSNQSVRTARRVHQRCDHCGGPFGLVTHRWWGNKFCKRRCKDAHIRGIMLNLRTLTPARKSMAMVPRFAWNCSRGLRTLVCVVLIQSLSGPLSNLEAGYCGQSFDLQAARIRWANTRATGPNSEEPDRICRAYGKQFYEAVEVRQAVSLCDAGVERQKRIEILDAEIDTFNNLIATQCGT